MKPITQENRIYLAIWRKALEGGKEITLKMENNSLAMSARMAMYRAIRPYREGRDFDAILAEAAAKFVIVHQKKPPALIMTLRKSLSAAEAMMAELGMLAEDLLTPEELAQRERLLEIQQEGPVSDQSSTPFYTRET